MYAYNLSIVFSQPWWNLYYIIILNLSFDGFNFHKSLVSLAVLDQPICRNRRFRTSWYITNIKGSEQVDTLHISKVQNKFYPVQISTVQNKVYPVQISCVQNKVYPVQISCVQKTFYLVEISSVQNKLIAHILSNFLQSFN
jgi:hypothetical protein